MYCTQCGEELASGARYCTKCGAKVASANGSDKLVAQKYDSFTPASGNARTSSEAMESSLAHKASEPVEAQETKNETTPEKTCSAEFVPSGDIGEANSRRSPKSSIIEFRHTTLKAIPTFVLAIIAVLATIGTAYAAYRIIVDVVAPAIERTVEQPDEEKNIEDSANTDESVNEEAPDSLVRVTDFLSGNPDTILARIDKLGLEYAGLVNDPIQTDNSWAPVAFGSYNNAYIGLSIEGGQGTRLLYPNAESSAWDALKERGLYEERATIDSIYTAPGIYFGSNWVIDKWGNPMDGTPAVCSAEDLGKEHSFDSIYYSELPLVSMDPKKLDSLRKLIGLSNNAASYWMSSDQQATKKTEEGDDLNVCALVGTVTTKEAEYLVYFEQAAYRDGGSIGVLPWSESNLLIEFGQLYSQEEFSSSTKDTQLAMIAQSIVQHSLETNGGYRINLRTGITEFDYYNTPEDHAKAWIPLDEAERLSGGDFGDSFDSSNINIFDYATAQQ